MPTELECQSCHLFFTVGWYHYHSFNSGYGAETRLVCARCGTMHAIEHAVTLAFLREPVDKSSSSLAARDIDGVTLRADDLPPEQKPDRLLAQAGPVFIKVEEQTTIQEKRSTGPPEEGQANSLIEQLLAHRPQLSEWKEVRCSRDFRPERTIGSVLGLEGVLDRLSLKAIVCNHCHTQGSLLSDWPEGANCPRCGGQVKKIGTWVT